MSRTPCRWRRAAARRDAVLVGALAAAFLVTGCSTDEPAETADEPVTEDVLDLATPPAPAAILETDRGEPPTTLQLEDLVVGTGEAVAVGDELVVEYLGLDWEQGQEFASSWAVGEPLNFELGAGRVIPGWEQGILGVGGDSPGPLRVGGRRQLVIPPDLAYGDRGAGTAIGPDETLVFVVDLVAIAEP